MKPKLLFKAPVLTASGYGVHSRQLLQGLLASNTFDITVRSLNWGQTPFLTESDPFIDHVRSLAEKFEHEHQAGVQYDVSVQVTIPNEFEKLARANIGVTAGIEVDRASPEWIRKCNEVIDLVVVPSQHSLDTLAKIRYQDEKGNFVQLQKPAVICPEGVNTSIFNTSPIAGAQTFSFDAPFNFICVGLGMDKDFGNDRKNISSLVKWFLEAFKGSRDVGLVLKVGLVSNSLIDFEATKRRIEEIRKAVGAGDLPRIHLVHGRLSDREMAALYKNPNVKAFVSLTHGEGFGLPLLEAAACGLPVIATNWSGHLDFLKVGDKKRFVSLDYDLTEVSPRNVWKGVIEQGSRWASVKEDDVKLKMKKVVVSYEKPAEWAKELADHVKKNYAVEKAAFYFVRIVVDFLNKVGAEPSRDPEDFVGSVRAQLQVPEGKKTLLFTMPMSGGDVFISTAVVDSLKKKFPEHLIFFATSEKYSEILKKNPNIHRVLRYEQWMANVPLCEQIFDEVYTPNLAIQTISANWVHGGKGRLLGNEIAHQCDVPFGDYHIETEPVNGLPPKYIVLHPGSGKGQWEARNYNRWNAVVKNLLRTSGLPIVQVGLEDDPAYEGCVDLRGKTTYNQLAYVIQNASCVVSIDSIAMHMAAAFKVGIVALFGSSYSTSTGPVLKHDGSNVFLFDSKTRGGCEKACYKYTCVVDKDNPCVNEIDPKEIVVSVLKSLSLFTDDKADEVVLDWDECLPKISGYTHVLNAESQGFPYLQSIRSMLGFCDEVVVVDGGSTDGTKEKIEALGDPRIQIYVREWDWDEPGMDGMQKAFGRAMCSGDFLWQQDADEVVHEEDYEKIRNLVRKFPKDVDLLHLPVVELWGDRQTVRTDRHSWKWRLSRNNFKITHGINKNARVLDEKTGRTYAKKGMSDGCEYVDVMTGDYVTHKGFYTNELEFLRKQNPVAYGEAMNKLFSELPSVFHYSWSDIPRKIRNFKLFWNKCWSKLYNDPAPVDRFPDVLGDHDLMAKAEELKRRGGEHGVAPTFKLARKNPAIME